MSLTRTDSELLAKLEAEDQNIKNAVNEAATAARHVLHEQYRFTVAFDDRHAALDAAIYRYLVESRS